MIAGHCARVVHAEINAISQAARRGIALKDATMYITGFGLCFHYLKVIIQAGIKRVIFEKGTYSPEYDHLTKSFAQQAGVTLRCLN